MAHNVLEMDPTIFRVARHYLDGGSIEWIAKQIGITPEGVADAWERSRTILTHHLIRVDELPMQDSEVFERSEECIRLLLHWEESITLYAKLAAAADVSQSDDPSGS